MSKGEDKEKEPETDEEPVAEEPEELAETLEEEPEEIPEEGQTKGGAEEKAEAEQAPAPAEEELPAPGEEKEKPPKKEKEEEEEIVEERIYTVPLAKALIVPATKRTPRAMRMLKAFITKHMKLEASKKTEGEEEEEPSRLIISNEVNLRLWSRGIGKPPRKIRVRAAKDKEGNVTVYLAEGD
jgi:large subunit ribosomal protein L31e